MIEQICGSSKMVSHHTHSSFCIRQEMFPGKVVAF